MSHEVETMAYVGETPWHGLGNRIDDKSSVEEMLIASGLNWELRREPVYTELDGERVRIPGKRAIIRTSDRKVMTVAGQQWKPLQNKDMLEFFRDYAEAGGAKLETAGSLRGGNIVWGLANLSDGFAVGGRDRVNGYLLFTSPHQVGAAIKIRTTTIRVVCQNTMNLANHRGYGTDNYSQNHLKNFNMQAAKEAVEAAHEGLAHAAKRAETLHNLKLSVNDGLKLLAPFCGVDEEAQNDPAALLEVAQDDKNWLGQIFESVNTSPGAEPETGWGWLQGVTHWADWTAGRSQASRMFNSWVGSTSDMKNKVEEKLFELAV